MTVGWQAIRDSQNAQPVSAQDDDPSSLLEQLEQDMTQDFPRIEPVQYEVKDVPDALDNDFALAFYMMPPVDDPEDNVIYVYPNNVSDSDELYSTLAHEGFPGHMYQTNYFSATNPAYIRQYLSSVGSMEGWAMYAESLALEYQDKTSREITEDKAYVQLNYVLSARLDVGINYEGWTLEDAEEYMALLMLGASAAEIYEVISTQPGVYTQYGLGISEYTNLRSETEAALGSNFDERDYHSRLLEAGPVPLKLLKQYVQAWTDEQS
jgi:uncharacterized protein (DUF885 family)